MHLARSKYKVARPPMKPMHERPIRTLSGCRCARTWTLDSTSNNTVRTDICRFQSLILLSNEMNFCGPILMI